MPPYRLLFTVCNNNTTFFWRFSNSSITTTYSHPYFLFQSGTSLPMQPIIFQNAVIRNHSRQSYFIVTVIHRHFPFPPFLAITVHITAPPTLPFRLYPLRLPPARFYCFSVPSEIGPLGIAMDSLDSSAIRKQRRVSVEIVWGPQGI